MRSLTKEGRQQGSASKSKPFPTLCTQSSAASLDHTAGYYIASLSAALKLIRTLTNLLASLPGTFASAALISRAAHPFQQTLSSQECPSSLALSLAPPRQAVGVEAEALALLLSPQSPWKQPWTRCRGSWLTSKKSESLRRAQSLGVAERMRAGIACCGWPVRRGESAVPFSFRTDRGNKATGCSTPIFPPIQLFTLPTAGKLS